MCIGVFHPGGGGVLIIAARCGDIRLNLKPSSKVHEKLYLNLKVGARFKSIRKSPKIGAMMRYFRTRGALAGASALALVGATAVPLSSAFAEPQQADSTPSS